MVELKEIVFVILNYEEKAQNAGNFLCSWLWSESLIIYGCGLAERVFSTGLDAQCILLAYASLLLGITNVADSTHH